MADDVDERGNGSSPRGSKRKAEDLQLASLAPKRIKVERRIELQR